MLWHFSEVMYKCQNSGNKMTVAFWPCFPPFGFFDWSIEILKELIVIQGQKKKVKLLEPMTTALSLSPLLWLCHGTKTSLPFPKDHSSVLFILALQNRLFSLALVAPPFSNFAVLSLCLWECLLCGKKHPVTFFILQRKQRGKDIPACLVVLSEDAKQIV